MDYNTEANTIRKKQLEIFEKCAKAICKRLNVIEIDDVVQDAAIYFCKRVYCDAIPFTTQVYYSVVKALRDNNTRQAAFERAIKHFDIEKIGEENEM